MEYLVLATAALLTALQNWDNMSVYDELKREGPRRLEEI
jgi:hypothetical protein